MNKHFSFSYLSITIKGLSKKRHGTWSQDLERGNHADTASYSIAKHYTALLHYHMVQLHYDSYALSHTDPLFTKRYKHE